MILLLKLGLGQGEREPETKSVSFLGAGVPSRPGDSHNPKLRVSRTVGAHDCPWEQPLRWPSGSFPWWPHPRVGSTCTVPGPTEHSRSEGITFPRKGHKKHCAKYPLTEEWIKKMWHICNTTEYYPIKKKMKLYHLQRYGWTLSLSHRIQ